MARGTLGITADGAFQLRFERHFQRSPSEVWPWLVDPEKLARWLPGCQITASVDGPVVFDFGDEGAATGKVTSLQAPDDGAGHLEHTWEWEGLPISIVRLADHPHGQGITVDPDP